ncbi:MarR family winged helix-turn-helix transcriptional regulator [Micromonospora lupini]|uniref:MarR family transcriptional regulator n=1 Tax=Micromonospora lupini str. Lupac 08 TaxID=1150864 RepID=I0L7E4_9ACTN|nr:MarR family transcriptional regulator [Micromonospora lupini]CCH19741.1 MarR family transcriptional regulator [Micromonospora lupini str. Lupac 08]
MAERRGGQPDVLDLWRQLTVLTGRLGQTLDKRLVREFDLTLTELLVLDELTRGNPRGMRIQDLSDAVALDQSSMSRLVSRLTAKQLAARVSCDHDRRGVYCQITDLGTERHAAATRVSRAELGAALDAAAFDDRLASVVARLTRPVVAPADT